MSTHDEGGPAFPSTQACESWQCRKPSSGMSLRDWFAGQAMVGLCANPNAGVAVLPALQDLADACYNYADAMLLARAGLRPPDEDSPR